MSGSSHVRRHLAKLAEVRAAIEDPDAWSGPDQVGRRTCEFDLGNPRTPSRAVVTEHPAGLVVETRGGECRVEIVLEGAYEAAGGTREVGTVTIHQPGRTGAPATIGPEGATILEVFSRSSGATDRDVADLRDRAPT